MDTKALYAELKPSMESVATPLFDFSKQCLREQNDFLPHGLVLTAAGTIELVGASMFAGSTSRCTCLTRRSCSGATYTAA
jgi:hypothetical protein